VSERDGTPDDRREQMLRAAIEVIGERGFPDTRIADVGSRVGASSALVIYYFGTKDRLLTEALRYSEDLFYAEVAQRLAAIEGATDKLEALVRLSCNNESMDGLPGSWVLWLDLWAQAVRHPEVSRDREELDQRWRTQIAQIVREGLASGEFSGVDADDFALLFSSLLDGLVVQVALGDPTVTQHVAVDLVMRLCSRELGFAWDQAKSG
jgi:AcrR family transcriptional regulator